MHRSFEDDLDKLRTRLIRMGSLVEEQVEFAFRALAEGNQQLATIVRERDDKVDKLDLKIDKQCQRIFALNQPVASDLRLLLAAIKINNELERVGDVAVDVADLAYKIPGADELFSRLGMERITTAAFVMLKASLDSFINNDTETAFHILPTDSTVDEMCTSLQADIINAIQDGSSDLLTGISLLQSLHHIERIADHATNIAENVIFLVQAKLVRHRAVSDDDSDQGIQ